MCCELRVDIMLNRCGRRCTRKNLGFKGVFTGPQLPLMLATLPLPTWRQSPNFWALSTTIQPFNHCLIIALKSDLDYFIQKYSRELCWQLRVDIMLMNRCGCRCTRKNLGLKGVSTGAPTPTHVGMQHFRSQHGGKVPTFEHWAQPLNHCLIALKSDLGYFIQKYLSDLCWELGFTPPNFQHKSQASPKTVGV